jgi:hypothetical protein
MYNGMMYKSGDTFSPETCKVPKLQYLIMI